MFRWTGRGWVGVMLWLTVPSLALVLAVGLPQPMLAFAALNTAIGVPLHIVVGRALNTRRTPEGREITLEHSQQSVPVQRAWFWYPIWSLIIVEAELWSAGHTTAVWVLGTAGVVALIFYLGWANREYRAAAIAELIGSPDGDLVTERAAAAGGTGPQPAGLVRDKVPDKVFKADLLQRWAAYGSEVEQLTPSSVTTGLVEGVPFTVFTMTDGAAGFRKVLGTMRTVCLVHLPVALPDLRLRPRVHLEDEFGPMPAVSLEPPWNYDLVVRAHAFNALDRDLDPFDVLTADAEVPGYGAALVTAEVLDASVRAGIIHWRVHNRDLIHVSTPGVGRLLTDAQSAAVVTGLVQIAKAFPPEAVQRFQVVPGTPADPL